MWEWQLDDSEVAEVLLEDGSMALRFSALVARALGHTAGGLPSDWGYALGVALRCAQVQWVQRDAYALGRIAEGRLTLDGVPCKKLPLPGTQTGAIGLVLRFANGATLHLTARAWQCHFVAEPRFRASYAC